MRLVALGSGSRGNAIYVEAGGTAVLFDAGFSGRELKRRLLALDLDPARLAAIIVSHEHTDHVAGLRVLGRHFPVYATAGTMSDLRARFRLNGTEVIRPGKWHRLGGFKFLPVPLSHDALEPVGFVIEDGDSRAAIITDLGVVTQMVRHSLGEVTVAVLEANHDPELLMTGPYPWEVKQRVKSRLGHLSNPETADLASAIAHAGLKHLLLAHLSETNNRPELARQIVREALPVSGVKLQVCTQGRPSEMVRIG